MEIYVQKDDAQQGPYTLDEIRTRIENGYFLPDDWGWHAELSDWVRLNTFFNDAAVVGGASTDIHHPECDGKETIPLILSLPPETKIVLAGNVAGQGHGGDNGRVTTKTFGVLYAIAIILFGIGLYFIQETEIEGMEKRLLVHDYAVRTSASDYYTSMRIPGAVGH